MRTVVERMADWCTSLRPKKPRGANQRGPMPKTESPSSDGRSAAPILRGPAFFVARGCVDHLELFLNCDVLALVRNDVDYRPSGALLCLVHQLFQLLLAGLHARSLASDLFAGIEFILARIGEEASHER